MTKVASFDIHYNRFIDPAGKPTQELPDFARDAETMTGFYRNMVLIRTFDKKAVNLQRTGRLGTYASLLGQEATNIGIASAMIADDVFLPSFRDQGVQILRGTSMVEILMYWGGDERGSDFQVATNDFPVCVPVGTHAPHAVGVAAAMRLREEKRAVLCVFGDGATSKGDVYEAMNLAGVWTVPVVFVVANNQWAISVPRSWQSETETLAQKAIAVGFEGEQVDGNDVVAVHEAVDRAMRKARDRGGPHLIEAITYRLGDHTTVDDATRYRSDEDVSKAWKEDPIARMRNYLAENMGWTKEKEEALIADASGQVEEAVEEFLATGPQPPEAMFDYMYADLPKDLATQRQAVLDAVREGGTADG